MTTVPALARLAVAVVVAGALSGCVSAAVGTAAAVGIAAQQERGVSGRAKDLKISVDIRERLLQRNHEWTADLGVTVYDGRVLLTGAVADRETASEAEAIAYAVPGVREVINEVMVADVGLLDLSRDTWITSKLEVRLNLDKQVDAVNYSVTTVDGRVYVMGTARDPSERERVIAHARDLERVRGVVSHVRLRSDPMHPAETRPGGA